MLLIVSNKQDLATDYLILRLNERNVPFVRINTEDYLESWFAFFKIHNISSDVIITKYGREPFSIKTIKGAYIRQPRLPNIDVIERDMKFSEKEVGEALKSLWRFIDDDIWLNPPHKILRASNKPEQLAIASSIGFNIPKTCISSDYSNIYSFYEECRERVIAKAVKHGFVFEGSSARIASTQEINDQFFKEFHRFAPIPMIYQEKVDKVYDIRVTVVGDKIFATAINSQFHEVTSVDWRLADSYNIALEQYEINLPKNIKKLCINITYLFGLKYSAIDMALGKDGFYYFLELNPNGQWAWLEQLGIHEIRDAIIDELLAPKRSTQ